MTIMLKHRNQDAGGGSAFASLEGSRRMIRDTFTPAELGALARARGQTPEELELQLARDWVRRLELLEHKLVPADVPLHVPKNELKERFRRNFTPAQLRSTAESRGVTVDQLLDGMVEKWEQDFKGEGGE